jgi:hypothetical protein
VSLTIAVIILILIIIGLLLVGAFFFHLNHEEQSDLSLPAEPVQEGYFFSLFVENVVHVVLI